MARFEADAALAAMTRKAHEVLSGRNMVAARGGEALVQKPPPKITAPTNMYSQLAANLRSRSVDALAGLMGRSQGAYQGLSVNPFPAARLASMAAAQRASGGGDRQGLNGNIDMHEFERGFRVPGYSGEQLLNLARRFAPTYDKGIRMVPHNITAEGQVFTDEHGRRYITVKFINPVDTGMPTRRTSTERVYLDN
jgi:hypothetical protein